MAAINEAGLTFWQEKELETAMRILPHAAGWDGVSADFDPVAYSLYMANKLITQFMKQQEIPSEEYNNNW